MALHLWKEGQHNVTTELKFKICSKELLVFHCHKHPSPNVASHCSFVHVSLTEADNPDLRIPPGISEPHLPEKMLASGVIT
jgi:hypothetical protein